MHLLGVKVDGVSSPGPNITTAPGINLIWLFCLFQKSLCFYPNPYFNIYVMMRRSAVTLTSISSPSLTPSLPCQSLLWALHLSHVNLVIPHILQLHHLPARKGGGSARRSWHQPVIPPFLLPPSVSLLNQIISLTHAQATPFLHQLPCPSFCSLVPSSLNPC